MSGQISGQVPNQACSQLTVLPQQNGSSIPSQIQSLGALRTSCNMDSDISLLREYVREKIFQILQREGSTHYMYQRLPDVARRLEEKLYKDAEGDYMNLDSLEHRLHTLVMRLNYDSQSHHQQLSQNMPSSCIATMIPTPGIAHATGATSALMSPGDCNMISCSSVPTNAMNSGGLLSAANGSAGLNDGSFNACDANKYQQSSINPTACGGNNSLISMGIPRMSTHMIPTPGLSKPQSLPLGLECSNGSGFSNAEPTIVSQQQPAKQFIGGQNGRLYQNLGGQMGANMRCNLQHKTSYGYRNGATNGGLQIIGHSMHMNGPSVSEGYLNMSPYDNSARPLSQQCSQAGDISGINAAQLSGPGNMLVSTAPCGSTVSSQNLNSAVFQSKMRAGSAMLGHHSNLIQCSANMKAQMFDHSAKMNFSSSYSAKEQILQSQQQIQKVQQQHIQQQSYPNFVHYQHQQKQQEQSYQQPFIKNDFLGRTQPSSSLSVQLMPEHEMVSHFEDLQAQIQDQYQFSESTNQYHQLIDLSEQSKGVQILSNSSVPQDFPPLPQAPQQQEQQKMQSNEQFVESHDNFGAPFDGAQSEVLLQGEWQHQPLPKIEQVQTAQTWFEQHVKEFHQRITREDEAQRPASLEDSSGGSEALKISALLNTSGAEYHSADAIREQDYAKQRRWLLFLRHARRCSAPEGKCEEVNCITVQKLLRHMDKCNSHHCSFPRCQKSKELIKHYRACLSENCPVCIPVREFVIQHRAQLASLSDTGPVQNSQWRTTNIKDASRTSKDIVVSESLDGQHSSKRLKIDHSSPLLGPKNDGSLISVARMNQMHGSKVLKPETQINKQMEVNVSMKSECTEPKTEQSLGGLMWTNSFVHGGFGKVDVDCSCVSKPESNTENIFYGQPKHENILTEQETAQAKPETAQAKPETIQEITLQPADHCGGAKTAKPKIKGVSLTELFTPEQVREHIKGLRQWVGQSKAKAEKNQAMEHSMSENSCQLCAVEKLTFEPPPIYCTPCGARIKRNAMYYTVGTGDTRHYFCIPCYNEVRGDTIEVDGIAIPKARLEKKKNDEETEEWWVQCDKCEAWQHQICALFNGRRNDGGQAEYTCPNCYIAEVENGERKPLPQSAVLGAKDLPRTILSDHIEQRLARRLKQERQERARLQGKPFDEVPGAESLVVRVVSSVDKKLEVKQHFLEIFQEENYPSDYPYKSKVILLFQKIEGVEVCLFGMYVQEFGSECEFPNKRRVYLSYLDSVKYFRPEIKAVTGEALRTFVYHEILIGYLEYCKKRGFTSCYIWACPPLKGEDYILYCHPEIQKTPKSDKLREWYLFMLKKATRENIVVDLTNLYDHFFVQFGECKAKITAARLPYFDGDYWPGAAEDMINQLRQEEDGRKQQKKGKTKKTITKRALKAAGQSDLSANASKDVLLMQKLGETICPMREDFIMVHLQHACTHCCHLMVSGKRWVCGQCKNFQLCDRCYQAEQSLDERERHPIHSRDKHLLSPVEIIDVPTDTKDKDEILESEFFDTRQAFLSLCQGNHYQYDTLRRAKHSSMMVLYHLHNPAEPAFVTTCNVCHHDIEAGQGWRCEVCPDFDVCSSCYDKDGGVDHPHKLTNYPSAAERDVQSKEARQKRVLQLREMLNLLVHASQCRSATCKYPNCRQVKQLFRHGTQCKTRAAGGCVHCKKMWHILQLHARACKESDCHVPRCRDLKEHMRRLQQQSDSRRRAAVNEMMRQRAAEVAGNSM